ncbi:hypothetical protein P4O66_020256 [Electrophorus voltai]|uniref:Uncharacterized protein n=1 Tax=Electrophorus voltai TaxID=2609070 RepID=A0AAD8ZRR6_9TELE|nr:hypothetical protein P4O66_020256 [Electrophorus voltai]
MEVMVIRGKYTTLFSQVILEGEIAWGRQEQEGIDWMVEVGVRRQSVNGEGREGFMLHTHSTEARCYEEPEQNRQPLPAPLEEPVVLRKECCQNTPNDTSCMPGRDFISVSSAFFKMLCLNKDAGKDDGKVLCSLFFSPQINLDKHATETEADLPVPFSWAPRISPPPNVTLPLDFVAHHNQAWPHYFTAFTSAEMTNSWAITDGPPHTCTRESQQAACQGQGRHAPAAMSSRQLGLSL